MKNLNLFSLLLFLAFFSIISCDKELREHPMPASLKRQMEMQNDPKMQKKKITGIIKLSPKLSEKTAKNSSLFIFARPSGVVSGPPLAVKRITRVEIPYPYSIGQMNVMLEGINFEGMVDITARLDSDGSAQASPGDIEGKISAHVGEENRDIILDHLIPGKPFQGAPGGQSNSRMVDKVIPALLAKANKTKVSGRISIAPKIKGRIPDNAVLFIFARKQGVEKGPPLVVKLLKGVSFPIDFTLSQQDAMMPGVVFSGKVTVTARIDQNAKADSMLGDIYGSVDTEVGKKETVEIILNNILGG